MIEWRTRIGEVMFTKFMLGYNSRLVDLFLNLEIDELWNVDYDSRGCSVHIEFSNNEYVVWYGVFKS